MIFTKVFTLAALAVLPALAAPSEGLGDVSDVAMFPRGAAHRSCRNGEWWDGWKNQCKCRRKGSYYDSDIGRCNWPRKDQPQCSRGQRAYCARSQDDYTEYDRKDDRCRNDGRSLVFCCDRNRLREELRRQFPRQPSCPRGQYFNWDIRACSCAPREYYRNGRCTFPPLPQPNCRKTETGWCAKDKNNYVNYDQNHEFCQDDGNNICFCDRDPKDYCRKYWHD